MKKIAFIALAVCLHGPAQAGEYPKTVVDGRGVEVTIKAQPDRIAALWTGAADLLVALDRPPAGVTTYEGKMPVYLGDATATATDLGDITAPNLELMAVSNFDLTIGLTRYNAPYAEDIGKFSQFISYEGFNIEGSLASMAALGEVLGETGKVQALNAEFLATLDQMASQTPSEPREVLFIWSFQNTLYGYKENLLTAEMLSRIGAVNPLGAVEGSVDPSNAFEVLEAEDLLEINPDVILMFVSHGGPVAFQPAYERLKAYQNGEIYSVGYQYSQPSGPIARDMVLREAAHLIYPDVYEKPSMPDAARAVPLEFVK